MRYTPFYSAIKREILNGTIGEIINIEGWFERFGEWLKVKTGNSKDPRFVEGFITASFTVCIGAMAIVGSIQDGISHDYSILLTKWHNFKSIAQNFNKTIEVLHVVSSHCNIFIDRCQINVTLF